jgi:hypothetical protein
VRWRDDYAGLAEVFVEAADCRPVWQQALQGFNMIQSQVVLEWIAEGEAKGKMEGGLAPPGPAGALWCLAG